MPPRDIETAVHVRLYAKDENVIIFEIPAEPAFINYGDEAPGLSFNLSVPQDIEFTASCQLTEVLCAMLLGMPIKKYRREKRLRHIMCHTKSGRIRKKAAKEWHRSVGG